jgi:Protein of unknown function (DUF1501)
MLSIGTNGKLHRREMLRIGSLGFAGITLPQWLATQAEAGAQGMADFVKDRSVIFLFLHGGPSQIETFDPKMGAPVGIRSMTGEVETSLPGVTFGGSFPKIAARAKQVSVVRSYRTGDGNHDIKPIVCKATGGANMGSLYARVAGANHPQNGMPRNCAVFPRSVDAERGAAQDSFGKFWATGTLGSAYAPFVPGAGGDSQKALTLTLPRERFEDRRSLLGHVDQLKRQLDASGKFDGLDKFNAQAIDTILGGVADAFNLQQEDPRTIAQYDTAPLVRPTQISRKWNNYNHYVDNAMTLGKLLLLARRLCERGCGFVTVTTNFVWDMHADVNNATMTEGMEYCAQPLDHAVAAFLDDVQARGLSDKILLVVSGEMGRTPKVNAKGGRDHWGNSTPLLLAGGGLPMGQVIGQTTRDGGEPATEPFGIENLVGTLMHSLLDLGKVRLLTGLPNDLQRAISSHAPISGLG